MLPAPTTRPPRVPAPGPRSITWSARRIVSSSCSTTSSVLPLRREPLERVEQHPVVARVQADRRLVEHVADAAQVGAELRRRGGCAVPRRRRASARRGRARCSPGPRRAGTRAAQPISALQVARDLGLASVQLRASRRTRSAASTGSADKFRDRTLTERDVERDGIEPLARALRARRWPRPSNHSFHQISSPVCSASKPLMRTPVPKHALAPAVLRVVRKEPRVGLGEAAAAGRDRRGASRTRALLPRSSTWATPLPRSSARLQRRAQLALGARRTPSRSPTGSSMRVLLEAVESRPARGRQALAVHAQFRVALARAPTCARSV